jgi:uncharacterized protein (TIGR02679 family)
MTVGGSGTSADDKLRRLLGGDDVAWLVQRARDRMEAGRPLTGSVTLSAATPEQRSAVERLIGRAPRSGTSLSVSLAEVDRILRASRAAPGGLAEAVIWLTGPVRDLARDRADQAAAWSAAFGPVDAAVEGRDELTAWRSWLDSTGVVRRLMPSPEQAVPLLAQVAAVLDRIPSPGVPIGRLAAECCGDAHSLDDGRPVGTLALSAARALAGRPFAAESGADSRRSAWAGVGVHLDELSSLVLCLGLPGDARTPLGRTLAACLEAGQPAVLTLRQLRCHDGSLGPGLVRICENPVVVAAAADELGTDCGPLVCVGGQPSAATWRLLELLAEGGADFGYHGDFDWGGVRIAEAVRQRTGWRSWRYDRASYEAGAAAHPLRGSDALGGAGVSGGTVSAGTVSGSTVSGSAALTGTPAATPWDPGLAPAMRERGLRVEEELSLDLLLADLGS